MSIERALNEAAAAVNRMLDQLLPPVAGAERRVVDAMRYATMGGGKRIRPYLVINSALMFDVHHEYALRAAAAIEMLHCYSLVHDDLPARMAVASSNSLCTVLRPRRRSLSSIAGKSSCTRL